jgi:signal transduction histidine kinase
MTRRPSPIESKERWADGLVAVITIAGVLEILVRPRWGDQPAGYRLSDASRWLELAVLPLWTVPLLARRWSGLAAGIGVAGTAALLGLVANAATDSTALFCAYLAGAAAVGLYEDRVRAVGGGIAMFVLLVVLLTTNPGGAGAGDVFVAAIFTFGPLAAAQVLRELTQRTAVLEARAQEMEALQAAEAEAAVAEERARIANELHDVIAQGVMTMTLQAGAARLLLRQDPAAARAPILAVEEAGREALTETRRLLGILRQDAAPERAPQPGIGDLDALFAQARATGLDVTLGVEGRARAVAPGIGLAAYRVVSDACDYTREAGAGARVDVMLRWRGDALEIEVSGNGRGAPDAAARLVARVAERIGVYNGTLETLRPDDGSGVFTARIPLEVTA